MIKYTPLHMIRTSKFYKSFFREGVTEVPILFEYLSFSLIEFSLCINGPGRWPFSTRFVICKFLLILYFVRVLLEWQITLYPCKIFYLLQSRYIVFCTDSDSRPTRVDRCIPKSLYRSKIDPNIYLYFRQSFYTFISFFFFD